MRCQMPGPVGTSGAVFDLDEGTLCMCLSMPPTPVGLRKPAPRPLTAHERKLAAIAYGEASTANVADEIRGIAFAVANRCRAWGHKTVDQLLKADPNYTYAVSDGNQRYARLTKATQAAIDADPGMSVAAQSAIDALAGAAPDPSNGAFWWDGVDFKTNQKNHPKVKNGFRYGDPSHDIFSVPETSHEVIRYYLVQDKQGHLVQGKERGRYSTIWVSTAAHGSTIFWTHDADYLAAEGLPAYK